MCLAPAMSFIEHLQVTYYVDISSSPAYLNDLTGTRPSILGKWGTLHHLWTPDVNNKYTMDKRIA